MRSPERRTGSPQRRINVELAVYGLAIALGLSTTAGYWLHREDIPVEMQFIPKESAILVASGPIESLWRSIQGQFGDVIDLAADDTKQSVLSKVLKGLRDVFKDSQNDMNSIEDVRKAGIDPRFGVLLSVYRDSGENTLFLAVVHVQDRKALELTLDHLNIDGRITEFPGDNIAVIANNPELLARSRDHAGNLRFARQNDDLYEGIRRCLETRLGGGAHLFTFVRSRSNPIPGVRQFSAGIVFDDKGVRVRGLVDVSGGTLKLVDNMIAEPPPPVPWAKPLFADSAGALAVHDNTLSSLIETAGSLGFQKSLENNYGGVLWAMRGVSGLQRIVISVTGWRDGLPDLLMSLWGDPNHIREILLNTRLKLRKKRDIDILAAAVTKDPGISDAKLRLERLPEEYSTFSRYTVSPDGNVTGQPMLVDLDNGSYSTNRQGVHVDFVGPRPTANDRIFRSAFESLTDDDLKDVEALDRYRIGYKVSDGVTWIATDAKDLVKVKGGEGGLSSTLNFKSSTGRWTRRDKLELFLNIDEMSTLGMLSPEDGAATFGNNLRDLRNHPAVVLQIAPCSLRRQCLMVEARAWARRAIR